MAGKDGFLPSPLLGNYISCCLGQLMCFIPDSYFVLLILPAYGADEWNQTTIYALQVRYSIVELHQHLHYLTVILCPVRERAFLARPADKAYRVYLPLMEDGAEAK